jgi:hypothetical protein
MPGKKGKYLFEWKIKRQTAAAFFFKTTTAGLGRFFKTADSP